jgi:hypothetical protein
MKLRIPLQFLLPLREYVFRSHSSKVTLQSHLGSETVSEADKKAWDEWKLDSESFVAPTEDKPETSENGDDMEGVPLRQSSAGESQGLTLVLNNDESDMSCPQFEGEGTRVSKCFAQLCYKCTFHYLV